MKKSKLSNKEQSLMLEKLKEYMDAKRPLDMRICENEKWFRNQHWDIMRSPNAKAGEFEPSSSFMFNAIANKHADAIDAYPYANILEREREDSKEAQALSVLIPFVLQNANFKQTYSKAWWYKLKHGTAVYGVFFNPEKNDGLGDIDIERLNLLNLFWEPEVEDIQKSKYFYITNLIDNDYIEALYPQVKGKLKNSDKFLYTFADSKADTYNKSLVVDCYYKRVLPGGRICVHLAKFVGNILLECSEDNPQTADFGLYDHGMYPVIFDVMYPLDGTPVGFGIIDIVKNPQAYIDRIDQLLSQNALVSGKVRWLIKDNGGINEEELCDVSNDVIHVAGSVNEDNIKQFQARSLDPYIITLRQNKISELKDIAGNRDFSTGATSGGVTAYGAIVALQEAGNKLSRDTISESYETYRNMLYMVIELIRQFYDEERKFRIIGNDGKIEYVTYTNRNLKPRNVGKTNDIYRLPVFDIDIRAEKETPLSRVSQNQLALDLYKLGFFNPARIEESMCTLELMNIENKAQIKQLLISIKEQLAKDAETDADTVVSVI